MTIERAAREVLEAPIMRTTLLARTASCLVLGTFALAAVACSSTPVEREAVATTDSKLSASLRRSRTDQIKVAAASRGITNALLIAGIASHESGLAQCWSEATWHCPGPYSSECGGPVMTGSGDGPCSLQQGGIGMFQLDSGTWWQTLAQHGNGVLDVQGNVAVGTDFIIDKVRYCHNTPSFPNRQAVVDWINAARPGTADYESFMTAMASCYNGCLPWFTGCNHGSVRSLYRGATQSLLSEMGNDYWYGSGVVAPGGGGGGGGGGGSSGSAEAARRVAENADGRLEVFVRGGDGAVWHAWQTAPNGGFDGWSSLGGSASSDPVAAKNADGRLEVFVRDAGGNLAQRWQTGEGAWSDGWLVSGGVAIASGVGSIAVGSNADGRLEVFARTAAGAVVHRWQHAPNGGWSDWADAGGFVTSGIAMARNADGRLEVFARGGDGSVWHKWQEAPSGGWSDWWSLGGDTTEAPAAARSGNGSMVVFARGSDGHLSWRGQSAAGWTDWSYIGGPAIAGSPSATVNADGRVEVFARSGGDVVFTWEWAAGAHDFEGLQPLGGGNVTSTAQLGHSIDGRLELFARRTDGSVAHVWQLPEGGWSPWSTIGGNVPSF